MIVTYGITVEIYNLMWLTQRGLCAICLMPERAHNQYGPLRLAVDHDHETGKVRGLLCRSCNGALGAMETWQKKHRERIGNYLAH